MNNFIIISCILSLMFPYAFAHANANLDNLVESTYECYLQQKQFFQSNPGSNTIDRLLNKLFDEELYYRTNGRSSINVMNILELYGDKAYAKIINRYQTTSNPFETIMCVSAIGRFSFCKQLLAAIESLSNKQRLSVNYLLIAGYPPDFRVCDFMLQILRSRLRIVNYKGINQFKPQFVSVPDRDKKIQELKDWLQDNWAPVSKTVHNNNVSTLKSKNVNCELNGHVLPITTNDSTGQVQPPDSNAKTPHSDR